MTRREKSCIILKDNSVYLKPLGTIFINMLYVVVVPLVFFTISSKSNTTHCAEYALREYWGYKPTLQGLQKAKYSDKDWKKMLKDDLKAGRPIIYSGYGDGGHCFVCDGYNEDEYFHFNWGWGGMYDGYFLLNALAPGSGGIGSGGGTYNNDQQAIFGVEPLRSIDGDESAKDLHLASTMSLSSSEIAYKEGFSVSASIKNGATEGFSGDLGLALYDSGLELLTIIDVQDTTISAGGTIDCTFGTEGWSELVAGLYYAAIYSKTAGGEWKSIGGGSYRNMVQFRVGIQEIFLCFINCPDNSIPNFGFSAFESSSKPYFKSTANSSSNNSRQFAERTKPKPMFEERKPKSKFQVVTEEMLQSTASVKSDSDIQVGSIIQHDRFGIGKVLEMEGMGGDTKATIQFTNFGRKVLLLKFAKLTLLK